MALFDLFDFVSSNVLLPVGGMLISIFVGWVLDRSAIDEEIGGSGRPARRMLVRVIVACLRYVAPVCILIVFLGGLGLFD